jgi:hypothetical protein
MLRTAIRYARSNCRENLDRQVRELNDRAGVVPIRTVAQVAIGSERHVGASRC